MRGLSRGITISPKVTKGRVILHTFRHFIGEAISLVPVLKDTNIVKHQRMDSTIFSIVLCLQGIKYS